MPAAMPVAPVDDDGPESLRDDAREEAAVAVHLLTERPEVRVGDVVEDEGRAPVWARLVPAGTSEVVFIGGNSSDGFSVVTSKLLQERIPSL
jgi:hypothetical protein